MGATTLTDNFESFFSFFATFRNSPLRIGLAPRTQCVRILTYNV